MVWKHGWCPDCGEHIVFDIRIGADGEPFWTCPKCRVTHLSRRWYKLVTEEQAKDIINHRGPRGLFVLFVLGDRPLYVGIDNRTGDALTGEFPDLDSCIRWMVEEGRHGTDGSV